MSRNDLVLERVHAGQATDAERAFVLTDPDLFSRLKELEADDQSFHAMHPAIDQVTAIRGKVRIAEARDAAARRKRALTGFGALTPLAIAVAVAVVQPAWLFDRSPEVVDDDRAKGLHPRLVIHRATPDGAEEPLAPGAVVSPGDVLQLTCVTAGQRHGVIVSIDGAGATTLHHPSAVGGVTTLDGAELTLPHGYELDNAPYFERFFFVSSDRSIDVNGVIAAAEALAAGGQALDGRLNLPDTLQQATFIVRKASP